MKKTRTRIGSILLSMAMLLSLVPTLALAADSTLTTADLPAVDAWTKDRTEPQEWKETGADGQEGKGYITLTTTEQKAANSWYDWQGRSAQTKADFTNYWVVETELQITEAMMGTQEEGAGVRSSIWLKIDGSNIGADANLDWSILQFCNDGTKTVWQWWDASDNGEWKDVEAVKPSVGAAVLKIEFDNGTINQYIDGTLINSYTLKDFGYGNISAVSGVVLESRTFGKPYSTTWKIPTVQYAEGYDYNTLFVGGSEDYGNREGVGGLGEIYTLPEAIEAAQPGDTIVLAPGTYKTSLTIDKAITVTGLESKAAETIIEGPANEGQTITLSGGATLKNVTVTRDNSGIWADNKNTTGVSFGQNLTAPTTLENCIITRNRNGVYLNNSGTGAGYAVIKNNQIADNRTGINLTNNVNNTQITDNAIDNNTTLGIVYYEAGYGTDLDTVTLSGNSILGNWFGAVNLKMLSDKTTGSLSVGENTIVADGEKVKVSYASANEPSYDAQIPAWGGGEATAPAEKPADVILTPSGGQTSSSIANLVDYGSLEVESRKIEVRTADELRNAVVNAQPGDIISVYPGEYDIAPADAPVLQGQGGWYLPITANNVTIQGVDESGNVITDATKTQATIYSTTERANGVYATQNLITVFGNNVTITGLTIMPKVEVNKTIQVSAENFTITNCSIVPNDKVENAPADDAGSLYFAGNKGTVVVEGNYFKNMNLSFDSVAKADSILVENNTFDTPAAGDVQMISNVTWTTPATLEMADVTIRNNTFKNLPDGYKKLVLDRMGGGSFILENNELVNAGDRNIADMVTFDDQFFDNWEAFVNKHPSVVIIEDGKTTTLVPSATETDPVKTLTLSPADTTAYVGSDVTLTATMTGFGENPDIKWVVEPSGGATITGNGTTAVFQASEARTYVVTVVVNDKVTASSYITVEEPTSGGSTSYAITVDKADNGTVTASRTRASKGLTVTLTVKPDEGYQLDTLTVTDKNGNEVKLTDKGDGKYTFTMPASAVTVEASFIAGTDTGLPFTDVKADDWFYEAVKYAYDNKLMDGTSSTTFAPLMTTNRAMIVTILWRLEGQPKTDATLSFTDVESGVWYTDAVNWAASKGIVKGYSDTVFAPNDTVTREQLATILYRYAEYKEYDVSDKGDLTTFVDGANTSAWATEAMEWAVGSGLLTGKDGGKLDPTGTATRAEVATILMRFVENISK
ncbi:MAG: S-layer homology domain-containing protein [Clostridiales bacterium]|uniref:S-layer homology domain-containing protein n=1 Tax=Flavonifractor porci TaxID=3133422 RepID=UPI00309F96FE|nr:S-layer homology domain-containing protein [Clostridiales bacterium]